MKPSISSIELQDDESSFDEFYQNSEIDNGENNSQDHSLFDDVDDEQQQHGNNTSFDEELRKMMEKVVSRRQNEEFKATQAQHAVETHPHHHNGN